VDVRETDNLSTDWIPAESATEHGFDWRGDMFGKVHGGPAPYQLPATFRIPYVDANVDEEESFSQVSATTLQMSGITNTDMPFGTSYSVGMLIAEVEFATPGSADGIYLCYDKPAANQIQFKKLDGTNPTFPSGGGSVRFYGGSFFGPYWGDATGDSDSFLLNMCSPNAKTGGIRYAHTQSDLISATSYAYAALFSNKDTPMFAVRDGGVVYGRAFTTKAPGAGHSLTQWDQIETSLYTGTLAKITELDLLNSSREISLSNGFPYGNFIKFRGTGTLTVTRTQPVQGGMSSLDSGVPFASLDTTGTNIDIVVIDTGPGTKVGYYSFKASFTHDSTVTGVDLRVVPGLVNSPNGMSAKVQRRQRTNGSSWQDLTAAGWTFATGTVGTEQTIAITCDQNNTTDNRNYEYRVLVRGSPPTGATTTDRLHWANSVETMTGLGNNLVLGN
jgi:hypothetical protein